MLLSSLNLKKKIFVTRGHLTTHIEDHYERENNVCPKIL